MSTVPQIAKSGGDRRARYVSGRRVAACVLAAACGAATVLSPVYGAGLSTFVLCLAALVQIFSPSGRRGKDGERDQSRRD